MKSKYLYEYLAKIIIIQVVLATISELKVHRKNTKKEITRDCLYNMKILYSILSIDIEQLPHSVGERTISIKNSKTIE